MAFLLCHITWFGDMPFISEILMNVLASKLLKIWLVVPFLVVMTGLLNGGSAMAQDSSGGKAVKEKADTLPESGTLVSYANKFGTKLAFTVTGKAGGAIWGTNPYTLDSPLAVAAIHAGVLKQGQTGVVNVEIIQSPPAFQGSAQNGVTSFQWGPFTGGAYRIIKGKAAEDQQQRPGRRLPQRRENSGDKVRQRGQAEGVDCRRDCRAD